MEVNTPLNFDYSDAKMYCQQIGLEWLGDDFVRAADTDAKLYGFTQEQVDVAMRHHLSQVAWLFKPKTYRWYQRVMLALHFLFGI